MFIYCIASKAAAAALENYTTNGTANTESDQFFIKPGASRPVYLDFLRVQGKGASLNAMTGISFRIKIFPTTSSSGGSAITPSPVDDRYPAAVATSAGAATAAGVVTSGTGTPLYRGGCGCSQTGPGQWQAPTIDAPITLDGGANKSIDVFTSAPVVSMNYELFMEIKE